MSHNPFQTLTWLCISNDDRKKKLLTKLCLIFIFLFLFLLLFLHLFLFHSIVAFVLESPYSKRTLWAACFRIQGISIFSIVWKLPECYCKFQCSPVILKEISISLHWNNQFWIVEKFNVWESNWILPLSCFQWSLWLQFGAFWFQQTCI